MTAKKNTPQKKDFELADVGILLCLPDNINESVNTLPFAGDIPSFMLNVVDRPLLQHNVESLVFLGIKHIVIMTFVAPEMIRNLLGNGDRWGCKIDYHLIHDAKTPLSGFSLLNLTPETPVLLTHANIIYNLAAIKTLPLPCVINQPNKPELTYCLYATAKDVATIALDEKSNAWIKKLVSAGWTKLPTSTPTLSCESGHHLLKAQQDILLKKFPAHHGGYEIEPGVWMSRNVVLHPTVTVIAPVYFGEDCMIDEGVKIGPNVAVSHTCRIGNHTILNNSAIQSGTWIGEHLTCQQLIIRPGRIWNALSNSGIAITDNYLISSIGMKSSLISKFFKIVMRLFSRLIALIIWLIALPFHLGYRLAHHSNQMGLNEVILGKSNLDPNHLTIQPAVKYPPSVAKNQNGFHHLGGWLLPGLIHVTSGRWHWVGLPPRSESELNALDEDWRLAYLSSKIGLINEGWIEYQSTAELYEQRLSELYYVSKRNALAHDIKLLIRYPLTVLRKSK